jgi:hypothetical protein
MARKYNAQRPKSMTKKYCVVPPTHVEDASIENNKKLDRANIKSFCPLGAQ